jgi:hypothetical protein
LRLDDFALLQVVACDDEIGGGHDRDPGCIPAATFALPTTFCNSNNV